MPSWGISTQNITTPTFTRDVGIQGKTNVFHFGENGDVVKRRFENPWQEWDRLVQQIEAGQCEDSRKNDDEPNGLAEWTDPRHRPRCVQGNDWKLVWCYRRKHQNNCECSGGGLTIFLVVSGKVMWTFRNDIGYGTSVRTTECIGRIV